MYPKPVDERVIHYQDFSQYNHFENIQHNFAKNYISNQYEKIYLS